MAHRITITNEDSNFRIRKHSVRQIALAAFRYLRKTDARLNLIFTSDANLKRLNRKFLNHNRPTDVLAFPSTNEIIISPKRARIQAPCYHSSFGDELARYICHGIFHLAGFRDKTKKEKIRMRACENKILNLSQKHIKQLIQS